MTGFNGCAHGSMKRINGTASELGHRRDEVEKAKGSWTMETLKEYEDTRLNDLRGMLQERYEMQTKAVDAAFSAQQLAMQTAKSEQATAMTTALDAAKDAVNTAMSASEKAVAKAETSTDKRFEAVNEFRAQLSDQAGTFATRNDLDVRIGALTDKLSYESEHLKESGSGRDKEIASLRLDLSHRLDLEQGRDTGTTDSRTNKRQDTGLIVSIGSLILAVIAVATTIITVLSRAK